MPINEAYLELDGAISAEFQQSLTPADAHNLLKAGHERFLNHLTHRRSRGNLLADAAEGQYPYAAVLGCIDSRVPVEELFDAEIKHNTIIDVEDLEKEIISFLG